MGKAKEANVAQLQQHHAEKLQALRAEMRAAFVERNGEIDGALTALLAGEHVLLLGSPGTAKSALAEILCESLSDATYFEYLLTKFTTPEELFGPMSVKGLQEDRFRRVTRARLPEAHVAFLDEIFKANSSILNALLTLANEREFDNDGARTKTPLETIVGASNELPESGDLEALYDRFMFRYWLSYIADRGNMKSMLLSPEPKTTVRITTAELAQLRDDAQATPISDAMLEVLLDVKDATERAGVRASDRRWRKILKALRCYAYLQGDTEVTDDHFDLLPELLWREPKERTALVQEVGKIANPMAARATEIIDAARETFNSLPNVGDGKAKFLAEAADANASFDQMESELHTLITEHPTKARKLNDAMEEIKRLHEQTQRRAAEAAGIRF